MKIVTIVGARPQFIKAAAVSRVISKEFQGQAQELIVHTGQHFDENMSQVFFDELNIPKPHCNLAVNGGGHGQMTGRMMEKIEELLIEEKPDWLLIYGDTNSTLAGALCAAKLHIPIGHVEAGLRSFNNRMPEEINRILSDRVSTLLFAPTVSAVENLGKEGIVNGVHNVGDVMYDVALHYKKQALEKSTILEDMGLEADSFVLATCHRAENTDNPVRLKGILTALQKISSEKKVVLPLHPRTLNIIHRNDLTQYIDNVCVLEPVGFLDMICLEQASSVIVTDSGGVQKEAYFYEKPCITMRDETEWVETITSGANRLVGAETHRIWDAFQKAISQQFLSDDAMPYGNGKASQNIVGKLVNYF